MLLNYIFQANKQYFFKIIAADMKKSSGENSSDLTSIQEPITQAPLEVKQVIERVLKLEKDKLYLKTPRNINDDILNIIKSVVQ